MSHHRSVGIKDMNDSHISSLSGKCHTKCFTISFGLIIDDLGQLGLHCPNILRLVDEHGDPYKLQMLKRTAIETFFLLFQKCCVPMEFTYIVLKDI